jgi:hypothetical protein
MNSEPPLHCDEEERTDACDTVLDSENTDFSAAPGRPSVWNRLGGGSLMLSLTMHACFVIIAIFVIQTILIPAPVEQELEFLPGGGGGGKTSVAKMAANHRAISRTQPLMRIVANSPGGQISLPDVQTTSGVFTAPGSTLISGGGMGGGESGVHGKGVGGAFGDGFGKCFGPGTTPGFVAMFGKIIKAQKLAVVLDVSGSMHRYLPTVVKEANKVSGGCPIVLFYGCGLTETDDRSIERKRAEPARGREFTEFWQRTFGGAGGTRSPNTPAPSDEVFKVFDGRQDTWYFERVGISYSWLALTSSKVREADAIYWFSDFQDAVSEAQLLELQKTLKYRKQKLYVHASGGANPSLAAVTDMLVKPSGGEVLQVEIK